MRARGENRLLRSLPPAASTAAPGLKSRWPETAGHGLFLVPACLLLLLAALTAGTLPAGEGHLQPSASAGAAHSLPDDGLPPAPQRRAGPIKKSRITTLTVHNVPATAQAYGPGPTPCRLQPQHGPCVAIVPAVESLVAPAGVHPALQLPPGQAPPAA